MTANRVVITDCMECNEHTPVDSEGRGMICTFDSNAGKAIPVTRDAAPIPDWCPKLDKGKRKITPLYRARLSCKIGRDALDGKNGSLADSEAEMSFALFNLLHAIEYITLAMEERSQDDKK